MSFLKPSTKLPQNRLVAMAVKRVLLRQSAKAGGVPVPKECLCVHEKVEYNEWVGATAFDFAIRYDIFANNATVIQQAITLTETCCVHVVATLLTRSTYAVADFDLEQPKGTVVVNQEGETANNKLSLMHYSCWEVLPAGVHTFEVVNRSGANRDVMLGQIKVVSYKCVTVPACHCEVDDVWYTEFISTYGATSFGTYYTSVPNGSTILSQAITLTETCCVTAVGTIAAEYVNDVTDFELEQPKGTIVVDQEDGTLAGMASMVSLLHYASYRVLPAGVYTFELVNRKGSSAALILAQLKLIACKCTLGVPPPGVEGNMLPAIGGIALAITDAALVGYYLLKHFKII